jgi:hypothetical protein
MAMFLSIAILLNYSIVSIFAFETIAPLVAVQISMSTSADQVSDVDVEEIIGITLRWKSVLATSGEPITINVTNGAEILITDENSVEFLAGGNPLSVKDVIVNPSKDVVKLKTASITASNMDNELIFQIKAPSNAGNFEVSTKIGLDNTPINAMTNYVERTFSVVGSNLYATISPEVVIGTMTFDIWGNTGLTNANDFEVMASYKVTHQGTGTDVFEYGDFINSDGTFSYGPFSFFNENAPYGIYDIEISLFDVTTFAETIITKQIEYVIPTEASITVDSSFDVVEGDTSFNIYGDVDYYDALRIAMKISNKITGVIVFEGTTDNLSDGNYSIGSFSFDDSDDEGIYVIEVVLIDSDINEVGYATKEIEHTKSIVEPLVPTIDSVGGQSGEIMAYESGDVTFPITTSNIPNETYEVTLLGAPSGVTGSAIIYNNIGTLSLDTDTSVSSGNHMFDFSIATSDGVAIKNVTLYVGELITPLVPTIDSVGSQLGEIIGTGDVTFPITTSNIQDGTYTVTLSGTPSGVKGSVTINNNTGTLDLIATSSVASGSYPFSFSITTSDGVATANATLGVSGVINLGSWKNNTSTKFYYFEPYETTKIFTVTASSNEPFAVRMDPLYSTEFSNFSINISSVAGTAFVDSYGTSLTSAMFLMARIDGHSSSITYNIEVERSNLANSSSGFSFQFIDRTPTRTGNITVSIPSSPQVKNTGNPIGDSGVFSTVGVVDLTKEKAIRDGAIIKSITTESSISTNTGNTWHELGQDSSWIRSTISSATRGAYAIKSPDNILVKSKWQFRYFSLAGQPTTMSNIKLVISYLYDITLDYVQR